MIPILIIIILSCLAIFVSILLQIMLSILFDDTIEAEPFDFRNYDSNEWFIQIVWWILQLALFIWGMIELYPSLN